MRSDVGPFSIVPEWILDTSVSDRAVRLYALLGRYANRTGEGAHPSLKLMQQRLRCSKERVQAARKELVDVGALRVAKRERDNGSQTSNSYTLVLTRQQGGADTSYPLGADTSDPLNDNQQNELFSETSSPQRDDVQTVYDVWRSERKRDNKRYDKITPLRRKKIETRLGDYTAEELIQAIRGVACDPWEGRKDNDDLTIIFRSAEQVDKFIALAERGGPPQGETKYRQLDPGEQF